MCTHTIRVYSPVSRAALMARRLRRRCAWCREPMDGLGPLQTGERISDGICERCLPAVLAQLDREERQ